MNHSSVTPDLHVETHLRGAELLAKPSLNKGIAFSKEERQDLGLKGLLPSAVLTLEELVKLSYEQYSAKPDDLSKNIYLASLHDRNEVLFYRLLIDHLPEMLPIVYTPTVGQAIQHYSHQYRRPRGIFLSIDDPDGIEESFKNFGAHPEDIDLIVVTDGERILGIGDQGVGGINIAIGKLLVYTAAAGIDPNRVIPVMLDVGTDNERLLNDPIYIGNRHPRVRGERYDAFIDAFVKTSLRLFPNALLHWEDFGQNNARPILEKYCKHICTFNDDIQGTGAVSLAVVLSSVRASNIPLREHRIAVFGAGTAGIGIAEQIRDAMVRDGLSEEEANRKFWCLDKPGLLFDDMEGLRDFQQPFARPASEKKEWKQNDDKGIGLLEVVKQVHPTILIGTSTLGGAFTEEIVKEMAAHVEKPVILPLSNPTSNSEAKPEDLIKWTDGRALVATGSPFEPVQHNNQTYQIGQANNAFVFPGIGLGTIVCRAQRVTNRMLVAAAEAVAEMVETNHRGASLLPPVEQLQNASEIVAVAVVKAAVAEGVAQIKPDDVVSAVRNAMWQPVYKTIKAGTS